MVACSDLWRGSIELRMKLVQTPNPLARPKAASLVEELRGLRGLRERDYGSGCASGSAVAAA